MSATSSVMKVCGRPDHRHKAIAAAKKCLTCKPGPNGTPEYKSRGVEPCLCCRRMIDYYSCSPGYCSLCAHDPCWRPLP